MTTQRSFVEDLCLACEVQLVNHLHQMLGDRERARELAQESFAALYAAYTPEKLHFPRAALFRIATNFALMELRRRRVERRVLGYAVGIEAVTELDLPESDALPADRQVLADQVADCVAKTVKELRPTLRSVFVMAHLEGKPRREIATALGISEKRVDKRMTKALKQCRARLCEVGIDMADVLALIAIQFGLVLSIHSVASSLVAIACAHV